MSFGERTAVRVAALALMAAGSTQAIAAEPKPGSLYLQCDGQPNNVTAGETAARLLGAVTLLGLFAPAPEASDPAKRKFGAEGVAACTALIEGDKAEGNAARRVGLILARAVHRIEAKDYRGAVADTALGRKAATDAGLMADPYYARSRGLAFDWIESAALIRQGQAVEARAAALRSAAQVRHALVPTLIMPDYSAWNRTASDEELAYYDGRGRVLPLAANDGAARLEEVGRFADAARVRDGLLDFERALSPELVASGPIAQAALAHALAGDRAVAAQLAAAAKANADKRRADGKPDKNPGEIVEILDLYGIVDAAVQGDLKGARRLFAARSQWVSPSFGSVAEVNRRLRQGAAPDELIGALKNTPDQLWKERADAEMAALLARDADNATLFRLIPAATVAGPYEAMSKNTWRTDKSKLVLKPSGKEPPKTAFETLFQFGASPQVVFDTYKLHAALLAKSRGQQGFVMTPLVLNEIFAARVLTGNRGAPGLPDGLFNDADAVIAALSPVIPSPEMLRQRAAQAKRASS